MYNVEAPEQIEIRENWRTRLFFFSGVNTTDLLHFSLGKYSHSLEPCFVATMTRANKTT